MANNNETWDAWTPGITSDMPRELLPLITLYDEKNSEVRYNQAQEDSQFCGLRSLELADLSVHRLALHEVMVRVNANLYVKDGANYEEFGLNLRHMADQIFSKHILPNIQQVEQSFYDLRCQISATLSDHIDHDFYKRQDVGSNNPKKSFKDRIFGKKNENKAEVDLPEFIALRKWEDDAQETSSALNSACLKGLAKIVGGVIGQHGRLIADRDIVLRLTTTYVSNLFVSIHLRELINNMFAAAIKAENYKSLPSQPKPVVMNVKGAAASGKSTLRPLQRQLSERLGVKWEEFALITPDYWRKMLIDYEALGENYKYASMLTGQELEIINQKLDIYIADKAASGQMPHLLIDRFKFYKSGPAVSNQSNDRLLSRLGDTVYLFFVITPPHETVIRSWERGKKTGRYKPVDDILFHNIEAANGMRDQFLNWVNRKDQNVYFEFLNNSVPEGHQPKTIAFGKNDEINILDLDMLRKLQQYTQLNVDARKPEDVYLVEEDESKDITETLVDHIPNISFFDQGSLELMAKLTDGKWVYDAMNFLEENGIRKNFKTSTNSASTEHHAVDLKSNEKAKLESEKTRTVGEWMY